VQVAVGIGPGDKDANMLSHSSFLLLCREA
jgi:hypothetical protein